nr:hypothetical protein [Fusarium oxysporum]
MFIKLALWQWESFIFFSYEWIGLGLWVGSCFCYLAQALLASGVWSMHSSSCIVNQPNSAYFPFCHKRIMIDLT